MKCERCGGSGKYLQVNPDCGNCPCKNECDDFGKMYCSVPSDCPDCNGTGTKPEPEQDVIMRQFEKCWHGVFDHLDKMLLIQITDAFRSGYKSGYTSRNAEIEALNETHELETKGRDELRRADVDCILRLREENRKQTEQIEALKAEIESMRCCWNCGNRKNRICNIKSEIPLGEDVCDYWTRKNNPKNSTPQ